MPFWGDPERTQTYVHATAKRGVDDNKQQRDQQPQKPGLGEYYTIKPNNCADGLDRTQNDQQLSLDGSSPPLTFNSGSLQLTPPGSIKAGKYKAYLLSGDRTVLAFLQSFEYSPISDSVAFSVKTHYKTNYASSVNNNVNIRLGNGVYINTDCAVSSLEIPSVRSCPDGEIRISYWQNADYKGDWYGYGYGSRSTCRGLWSNGWGFKSLWVIL
ncbi:uncharacterized protein BBA_09368 [Beauveria bassiana ARSEF 2860]|uniref:Uncharacterized protein n=1 Tax=Beauveria bassiana (strain ARSEF 2860) TaxID=655819 RepID=J5J4T0_BEAB2|nr:uncharacterized protein BBA_09368 [Beauveria bassiana ARSEF 2860]EJP61658.1 hypothetical protein BBA_09368 [Beauveria bassiana ARSEF 2860]